MDGFNPTEKIVVVAATNRLDLVDHAVLRSGRFDIKVHIPLPTLEQRKGILWTILDTKLGIHHNIQQNVINFVGESS
jgi:cell division protease FtsH